MKAICLLSGGLDSSVASLWARLQGYDVHTLSFDYQQRHRIELEFAEAFAKKWGFSWQKATIDSSLFGATPLITGKGLSSDPTTAIVPARNAIFLSYGLGLCEVLSADALIFGANADDHKAFCDCRPGFFAAFEALSRVYRPKMTLLTPLVDLNKAAIMKMGIELGLDLKETISCYQPDQKDACGLCSACLLRARNMELAFPGKSAK